MAGLFLFVAPWKASSGRMADWAPPMSTRCTLPVLKTTPSTRSPFTGTYCRGQRSQDHQLVTFTLSLAAYPLSAEVHPHSLPQHSSEHACYSHPYLLFLPFTHQSRPHPPPSTLYSLTRQNNSGALHNYNICLPPRGSREWEWRVRTYVRVRARVRVGVGWG